MMISAPVTRVAYALAVFLGCASAPTGSVEVLISPSADPAPEQLSALQKTISKTALAADWVEVERHLAQVTEAGHDTVLVAEAVRTPSRVAPHLCRGELITLTMRGEGFDRNEWRSFDVEQYAVYDSANANSCLLARRRSARFRVRGGIKNEEILGVLGAIARQSSDSSRNPLGLVELALDESISLMENKGTNGRTVIEVTTSTGKSTGRVLEFEDRDGRWIGRVIGGWIA